MIVILLIISGVCQFGGWILKEVGKSLASMTYAVQETVVIAQAQLAEDGMRIQNLGRLMIFVGYIGIMCVIIYKSKELKRK